MKEKFNNKKLLFSSVLFFCLLIVLGIILFKHKRYTYIETIEDWRNQKDEFLLSNPESPFKSEENFSGLSYFAPNAAYKVPAKIELSKDSTFAIILKNDGKKEKYLEYGIAKFKLKKKEYELTLYKLLSIQDKEEPLFLPFADRTNDEQTYIGGRYLDVELIDSATTEIDFNKAYNPFCAYNPRYSCAIPPQKNFIDIAILAGEKIYTAKKTEKKDSTNSK